MNQTEAITLRISAKDKEEFKKKLAEINPNLKVSQAIKLMIRAYTQEGIKSLTKTYEQPTN